MIWTREIPWREPIDAFGHFARDSFVAFLDSQGEISSRGRWSYLCPWPFKLVQLDEETAADPFAALENALAPFRDDPQPEAPPFTGGAVGFLAYELGGFLETLPRRHPDDLDIPMMSIGFYDVLLAFDRGAQRSWVIATGRPERALSAREARATFRIEAMLRRLAEPAPALPAAPPLQWQAERSPAEHQAAVARAQAYIRDGDIFQANITMRHLAARPRETHPASLYATLRAANRTPFSAYLDCGPTLAIASVSPERFLRLYAGGTIETRPIKGTRRRDAGAMTDMYLRQALAESGKDRAENLMITDLMRNDIGRVAEIGSVRVPELQKVETFATVHHMVSVVEAQLRRGCTAVDLLRATFPGGSITGAPKIRAMEIIDELEASRRGPYCGSIVWLGHDGAMDSSILIRTLVITPELIAAQAGGGIVAESDPREEWEEVMTKIRPLLQAFGP